MYIMYNSTIMCMYNILWMAIIASVNELIVWASETFPNAIFCIYEQINPFDGFGQVMYVLYHLMYSL